MPIGIPEPTSTSIAQPTIPRLSNDVWRQREPYVRDEAPIRALMLGSGMLLRALPLALMDAANRAGTGFGSAMVVQTTGRDTIARLRAQDHLYTVLERADAHERATLIGVIGASAHAASEWTTVVAVASNPALRVIVSNVTEAAFLLSASDARAAHEHAAGRAPEAFVGKVTALLHARFHALRTDAPVVVVIPTELVDNNGAQLESMVREVASHFPEPHAFRRWLATHVAFCGSLVDRITTGAPAPAMHARLSHQLGYADALLTLTEPFAFWAVEGDPTLLGDALPIRDASPTQVVFARSIAPYRERKLRLLNGAHTALAPLAALLGHRTVAASLHDNQFAAALHRLLHDEIAPTLHLETGEAAAFADAVIERFANPTLGHEWDVILGNQTLKLRSRLSSIVRAATLSGRTPTILALGIAAYCERVRAGDDLSADPASQAVRPLLAGAMASRSTLAAMLGSEAMWDAPMAMRSELMDAIAESWSDIRTNGAHGALALALARRPVRRGHVA